MRQFSYTVQGVVGNHVFVIDDDLPRFTSLTNAAEDVVLKLIKEHGPDKRFFYRDSQGSWDELKHDGSAFTGFAAIASEDEVAQKSLAHVKDSLIDAA